MRILLDTNVVLDFALRRQPFFEDAVKVINFAGELHAHLFITASTVTDVYYLLSKEGDEQKSRSFLTHFLSIVDVCPVNKSIVLQAIASKFKDVEDAVQHFAAEAFSGQTIVTRNKSDFSASTLEVLDPKEFCEKYLQ